MSKVCITSIALVVGLAACDHPTAPDGIAADDISVAAARVAQVGLPFKAKGFTERLSLAPDPSCGDLPYFLNRQRGEGRGTHLGAFTIDFRFCVDATDLLDDGQLTEGESLPYDRGLGVIVAANGDELYMHVEGEVLPSQDPDFDFQFQDSFEFVGGTGRFVGASGHGMNDSYVVQDPERTTHTWRGTLILRRGR